MLRAFLARPAGQAQSAYKWEGPTLLSAGLIAMGCNLCVPQATHGGSLGLNNIFVTVQNRGSAAVRITADVELSGNNSRKAGSISGIIQANPNSASMHVNRRAKGTPVPTFIAPRCRPARSRRRSGGRHRGAALLHTRFLNRQLSLPVSTMSQ